MTNQQEIRDRFLLKDGQLYGDYRYKNLKWELDGESIGYGDLRDDDILTISLCLKEGEEFVGWNEHHGTRFQQGNSPMVRIKFHDIKHRQQIVETEGH